MLFSAICSFEYADAESKILKVVTPGPSSDYTIPNQVTSTFSGTQNNYVFKDLASINFTVTFLADSQITKIGDYSFFKCEKLQSIDLSLCQLLTTIGSNAFCKCSTLSSAIFPESLKSLYDSFQFTSLTSVVFPKKFVSVPGFAPFAYSNTLKTVTFPADSEITILTNGLFKYTGLTKFHVTKNVQSIHGEVFGNTQISEFTVDPGNLGFSTYMGSLYSKDFSILYSYIKTSTDYHFPPELTTIGYVAFGGNTGDIVFPPNVSTFKSGSFYQHRGEIVVFQGRVVEFSSRMFEAMPNLKTLVIPEGVKVIPERCFMNCPKLKSLYLPFSLERIEESAFSLTEIECFYGNVNNFSQRLRELNQTSLKCLIVGYHHCSLKPVKNICIGLSFIVMAISNSFDY